MFYDLLQPIWWNQTSEKDVDADDPEIADFKSLQHRRDNLRRTAEVLEVHDVVVQKLITKARDDMVRGKKLDTLPLWDVFSEIMNDSFCLKGLVLIPDICLTMMLNISVD